MKYSYTYEMKIGQLKIQEEDNAITEITLGTNLFEDEEKKETDLIKKAAGQLEEYFLGERRSFELPLAPKGTEYQKKVWNALCQIPYGETRSYREIAEAIGNPKGCRSIGMANHNNPIIVVIPCHRVIGSNGKLVGYGGGLSVKKFLLELEAKEKKMF